MSIDTNERKSEKPAADQCIRLDLDMLKIMRGRLSLDDFGRLSVQIARAASAKRPSELQRLMLAVMTHKEVVT